MARCTIGDGKSALFWSDLWHTNCLNQLFPHLYSFVRDQSLSVQNVLMFEYLEDLFHLPLTQEAFLEFELMEEICDTLRSSASNEHLDTWSYMWGNNIFSVAKAYKILIGVKIVPAHFNSIWKCSAQPKHKVFFWRLLHDRLNTRNLLRRKTFHLDNYNCATLNCQQEETLQHLFWTCPFASACWDILCPNRERNLSIMEAIPDLRSNLHQPFSMEIIIIASWAIWIVRNDKIFNNIPTSIDRWKFIFLSELHLLKFRIKEKFSASFSSWLDTLVL